MKLLFGWVGFPNTQRELQSAHEKKKTAFTLSICLKWQVHECCHLCSDEWEAAIYPIPRLWDTQVLYYKLAHQPRSVECLRMESGMGASANLPWPSAAQDPQFLVHKYTARGLTLSWWPPCPPGEREKGRGEGEWVREREGERVCGYIYMQCDYCMTTTTLQYTAWQYQGSIGSHYSILCLNRNPHDCSLIPGHLEEVFPPLKGLGTRLPDWCYFMPATTTTGKCSNRHVVQWSC